MSTSHICKLYGCKSKYCQHHINVAVLFFLLVYHLSRLSACSPFWFRICLDGPVFTCANLSVYSCGWLLRKLLGLRRKYLTHYKYSYALLLHHIRYNIFGAHRNSVVNHLQCTHSEIKYDIKSNFLFCALKTVQSRRTSILFSNHIFLHDILRNISSWHVLSCLMTNFERLSFFLPSLKALLVIIYYRRKAK